VLVLRALGLGDLLTAVPALRGVRRAYPGHRIVLATPAALAPLALATGAIDEVLPASGLGPIDGAFTPEVAVNLHGRGPQSHRLLAALRPGRLVAFGCPEAGHDAAPSWYPGEYEVARWCRMLAGHGFPADPGDLAVTPPPPVRPGAVVVHPGAAHPRRRWPAERFVAVVRAFARAGEDVVLTGSAGERPLAAGIADAAGLSRDAVLAGRTEVLALAGLIASARLVLCGDTGVAHAATAFGTPSVVLFGPVSPAEWGPPAGRPRHVPLWHPESTDHGEPAAGRPDPALCAIGVPEVLDAAERLLTPRLECRQPVAPELSWSPRE
jgi:ADP-heptose:LPS heptosyltransferase